jgi:hypothetical protein
MPFGRFELVRCRKTLFRVLGILAAKDIKKEDFQIINRTLVTLWTMRGLAEAKDTASLNDQTKLQFPNHIKSSLAWRRRCR